MNILLIGGTGLISTGIVKHLTSRGASITMFNRGKRENTLSGSVKQLTGDRNDFAAFKQAFDGVAKFDAVIDMICFNPDQAKSLIETFSGKTKHVLFCSTVCTYGVKIPAGVVIDETFAQEPISGYGKNKVECERLLLDAHAKRAFDVTIVRPSHTYGPGNPLIDNIEFDTPAWDRIERGLPVLCAGDGLGLWQSTHRDDAGQVFAHAALNPKTFGQAYNAVRDEIFTWRDYYRQVGQALAKPAKLVFMPADWIVRHDPKRFGLLREITAFHGGYSNAKARRDLPAFSPKIGFVEGAKQTLDDVRRRKAWKSADGDAIYESMIDKATKAGVEAVEA